VAAKRKYQIVRTCSAGVFAGEIVSRKGQEVVMTKARRLWYWDGAASLSQLAVTGTVAPANCKFAMPADITVLEAIEILEVTPVARMSIESVAIWQR
jgi:hypothetical protein